MCVEDKLGPYALPLERQGNRLTYSLLLGKVTHYWQGQHYSSNGFWYPIRQMIYDPNALLGNHDYALHFMANPDSARFLLGGEYGSHRLAVLPAPRVWDPIKDSGLKNRCWHSFGAFTACCLDCYRIEVDVLTNPDFWDDLAIQPGQPYGIPQDLVWHKQQMLPPAATDSFDAASTGSFKQRLLGWLR